MPLPGAPPGEEPVAIVPIEEAIDLHGFAPRDIPSVVEEYLAEAASRGFREVRLIHGRGKGVQRAVVRRLLASSGLVDSFGDAPASRGGWGATVVRLRAPAASPGGPPRSTASRGKAGAGAGRAPRGGRRRS